MSETRQTIRQEKRRREILGATLRLVRRHGTAISTAQIAAEAKCSKETLYAWFNDRDGIMLALVQEQGQSMGSALTRAFGDASEGRFEDRLRAYALALVDIMTGEAVLAVNRIAMADACKDSQALGAAVVKNWESQVRGPFVDLLEAGRAAGKVRFEDAVEAFDMLVGLLIGDRQRRLLLGETSRPKADEMEQIVDTALARWFNLHGA